MSVVLYGTTLHHCCTAGFPCLHISNPRLVILQSRLQMLVAATSSHVSCLSPLIKRWCRVDHHAGSVSNLVSSTLQRKIAWLTEAEVRKVRGTYFQKVRERDYIGGLNSTSRGSRIIRLSAGWLSIAPLPLHEWNFFCFTFVCSKKAVVGKWIC